MKIDELLERERHVRTAMTNRAGVVSLLLHNTVDHEALAAQQHATPAKVDNRVHQPTIAKVLTPSAGVSRDLPQSVVVKSELQPAQITTSDTVSRMSDTAHVPLPIGSISPHRQQKHLIVKPSANILQPGTYPVAPQLPTPSRAHRPPPKIVMKAEPRARTPGIVVTNPHLTRLTVPRIAGASAPRPTGASAPGPTGVSALRPTNVSTLGATGAPAPRPSLIKPRSLIVNSVPRQPLEANQLSVQARAPISIQPSHRMPLLENILKKPAANPIQATRMIITSAANQVTGKPQIKTIVPNNKIAIVTVRPGNTKPITHIPVTSIAPAIIEHAYSSNK